MKSVFIKLAVVVVILAVVVYFFGPYIMMSLTLSSNVAMLKYFAPVVILGTSIWVFSKPLTKIFGGRND